MPWPCVRHPEWLKRELLTGTLSHGYRIYLDKARLLQGTRRQMLEASSNLHYGR